MCSLFISCVIVDLQVNLSGLNFFCKMETSSVERTPVPTGSIWLRPGNHRHRVNGRASCTWLQLTPFEVHEAAGVAQPLFQLLGWTGKWVEGKGHRVSPEIQAFCSHD